MKALACSLLVGVKLLTAHGLAHQYADAGIACGMSCCVGVHADLQCCRSVAAGS
jgi:hypothetical protein